MDNPKVSPYGLYSTPEEALEPLTNNSQTSFICRECPDENGVLHSAIAVDTPHPVWTNGRGKAVIQLDMVVIGGENGLNS